MANKKISAMTAAGALTGAELVEVVQSGNTRRTTATAIAGTIADEAVTNAKLAHVATKTIKGRTTAGTGDVEDLTAAQAAAVLQQDGLDDEAAGFRGIPVVDFSAATTVAATHGGKTLRHPASDANARTLTIDSNANLALPVGFTFTVINETSQAVTLAITSDTLILGGDGSTGSRTIAQDGIVTATKVASTRWYVSGVGVT
jgi:hypothetical protein